MKKALLLFVLLPAFVLAKDFPSIQITKKVSLHFGQEVGEVERLLRKKARQNDSPIARKEKDRLISLSKVVLEFDSEHLQGFRFQDGFKMKDGITVYKHSWKNFVPIGEHSFRLGMKKDDLKKYLAAWEARAHELGAQRYDGPELLKDGEYSISFTTDEFMDWAYVSFGPERSTGKGGSWGDGAYFSFVTKDSAFFTGKKPGTLESISVSSDVFNTVARR